MQSLRSASLPKHTTQFRSLKESVIASINARAVMLSELEGYPVAAQILAHVRKFFDLKSTDDLKQGIMQLRNCVKYASALLKNITLLKIDRYQIALGEVAEYVKVHASAFGYPDLSPAQLSFVAFLVTSAEVPGSAWTLEMEPNPSENLACQLMALYNEIGDRALTSDAKINKKKSSIDISVKNNGGDQIPRYYDPVTAGLSPITDIVFPDSVKRLLYNESLKGESADGSPELHKLVLTNLESESMIYNLADIRLVDHVAMLMLSVDTWELFISPRTKSEPGQNLQRAKSLDVFAAYLQSLLLYPIFFRFEMFKKGYDELEKWHGSFPAIPPDAVQNYNNIVAAYDALGASHDVNGLFANYHTTSDPNLGGEISAQFIELSSLYGIPELAAEISSISVRTSVFKLDRLALLGTGDYDHLLLSYPVKQFRLLDSLQQRLFERSRFTLVLDRTISLLLAGYTSYLSEALLADLSSLGPKVPFGFHQHMSNSFGGVNANLPISHNGSFSARYYAPFASAENEYKLRTSFVFSLGSNRDLYYSMPTACGYDESRAADLRDAIKRQWCSLYPSNMFRGEYYVTSDAYAASEIEAKTLVEKITGDNFSFIKRSLKNVALLEVWATVLSSFCLMYRVPSESQAKANARKSSGLLVHGYGSPYGVSYDELAALQEYNNKDVRGFIDLPDTDIVLRFLKRVPVPSFDLMVGEFNINKPYYYFKGNGACIEISTWTYKPALINFSLRPFRAPVFDYPILFDSLYAYENDSLYINVNPQTAFNAIIDAAGVFSFPLSVEPWRNDKTISHVKYKWFGKYVQGGHAPTSDASSKESEDVKLIKEMEDNFTKKAADTTVARNPASDGDRVIEEIVAKSHTVVASPVSQSQPPVKTDDAVKIADDSASKVVVETEESEEEKKKKKKEDEGQN